jgi:predicted RNA-binding Zn-ribbon protein involved in translation (DUF1610 family)
LFIPHSTVSAAAALSLLLCAAAPAPARGDGAADVPASGDAVAQADPGQEKTGDVCEGVRISGAYEKLKCPQCGTYNDLRAAECIKCGHPFPQPSSDVTDPSQVFVPGRGYYREGALLEPAQSRKILWVPGVVIGAVGLSTLSLALALVAAAEDDGTDPVSEGVKTTAWVGLGITAVGATLAIIGFTNKTEAVYAYAEPSGRAPVARAAGGSAAARAEGLTLKFGLSFNPF